MSDSRRKRSSNGGSKSKWENGEVSQNHTHTHRSSNSNNRTKGTGPTRPKTLFSSGAKLGNGLDHVRKIVQEEGRTARNLVQYNVPVSENQNENAVSGGVNVNLTQQKRTSSSSRSHTHRTPPPGTRSRHRSLSEMAKSPRSDTGSKKNDLRARYWKFMFDNFQRAVDSIYQTCEQDASVVECKEVIMMLEQSTKDFKALIETLNMMRAYETSAKEGDRPSAVAWEVRKMSPNKHAPTSPGPGYAASQRKESIEGSGNSWADKVKGVRAAVISSPKQSSSGGSDVSVNSISQTQPKYAPTVLKEPTVSLKSVEDTFEDDGWETVQRGRLRARHSPCQKSSENLSTPPSAKRNLMRSFSVPDQEEKKEAFSGEKEGSPPLRALSEKSLSSPPENHDRERAHSKDSEKENMPFKGNDATARRGHPVNETLTVITDKKALKSPITSSELSQLISSDKADAKDSLALQLDKEIEQVIDEELLLSSELELAQKKALAYAVQEEESWLKELAREQSSHVEDIENVSDLATTNSSLESSIPIITDWESLVAVHEAEMSHVSKTSWGDLVMEADEARTPGHGVHMHEKLSSPSRKRSPTESRRRHEEKQAKAQTQREKLMQEKAERLRELSNKVAEVRSYKEELMRQSKTLLDHKLQRAEEKRQSQLKMKSLKAHEEEAKANEIAFINSLEAQNKRHDIMSKHQESEARLHDLMEERQRRLEEKQAKEAAVEERRKALEADRKARLVEMQEKRKLRDARIEQQQLEKEKERLEAVRTKEKEREERLAAMNAHQEAQKQELQKKILQKQSETTQRHEVYLQQIRDRAFEMSIMMHSTEDHNDAPKLTPYENNKLCIICNVLIPSEVYLLSHLRGKKHQQALKDSSSGKEMIKEDIENFNLRNIIDAPDSSNHPKIVTEKERQKSLKKRCKKLRQRMVTRGVEYEHTLANKQLPADSEHKAKLHKVIKDMTKYIQTQDAGPWPQNKVSALDRALGELVRILEKKNSNDQNSFRVLGGFTSLSRILLTIEDSTPILHCVIPTKSLTHACDVYRLACKTNFDNCHHMLFSNKIGAIVDHLSHQLNMLIADGPFRPGSSISAISCGSGNSDISERSMPYDPLCPGLMQVLSTVLSCLAKHNPAINCSEASSERMSGTGDGVTNRGNDIISYIISVGIMDKLRVYLSAIRGPVDQDKNTADFLLHSLGLLLAITKFMSKRNASVFDDKRPEDPTQLICTLEVTEMVGIVSLLYGMLLHSGAPARSSERPPKELAPPTVAIILTGLRMLNHLAVLDLQMFQSTLGEEGLSLEFRHITSYLIWYCCHVNAEELLHEVVLCVGYFTVLHPDNQMIMQSGQPSTVLQQLCSLPFHYFSDPRLVAVLFPSLICCCYNNNSNRDILEQELSCALLANFIEERRLEHQQPKVVTSSATSSSASSLVKKSKIQESKESRDVDNRMSFTMRFPLDHWKCGQDYFTVPVTSS